MNNHIVIAGHLGADPEVRYTSSGQKVTTFRVASNSKRGGNKETIWWRITVWGDHLDKMISYLKKGSAVIVMGELQKPEIFTDRDGNPQISLNVVATSLSFSPFGRSDRSNENAESPFGAPQPQQTMLDPFGQAESPDPMMRGQGSELSNTISDEEIPF